MYRKQEKTVRNKIMQNNIQYDASQVEVLYKTQVSFGLVKKYKVLA